jgi:hypothetical protein
MMYRELKSDGERKLSNPSLWQPIATAPDNTKLELRVLTNGQVYSLPFACVKTANRWMNQEMNLPLAVQPIEWREWPPVQRLEERARSAAWPLCRRTRDRGG